jgi:hypothetical protein
LIKDKTPASLRGAIFALDYVLGEPAPTIPNSLDTQG